MASYEAIIVPTKITEHPSLEFIGPTLRKEMTRRSTYENMCYSQKNILKRHTAKPFDLLVGEDVSGRIPTLITHRFLRLAHQAGAIAAIPRTFFLASGRCPLYQESTLQENLDAQAAKIKAATNAQTAAVISEVMATGKSAHRVIDALNIAGVTQVQAVEIGGIGFYLSGSPDRKDSRAVVGVDKQSPGVIAHRHPEHHGFKVTSLRSFLNDYASAVYESVFDEAPTDSNRRIYATNFELTAASTPLVTIPHEIPTPLLV